MEPEITLTRTPVVRCQVKHEVKYCSFFTVAVQGIQSYMVGTQ